ncbi:hypothetical protein ACFSTD_22660 [Novosphingobium colocasiae]
MSELGILVPLAGIGVGALAVWTRHQRRLVEMGMTVTAEKKRRNTPRNTAL